MRNRCGSLDPDDPRLLAKAEREARETGSRANLAELKMMRDTVARHTRQPSKRHSANERIGKLKAYARRTPDSGTQTSRTSDSSRGNSNTRASRSPSGRSSDAEPGESDPDRVTAAACRHMTAVASLRTVLPLPVVIRLFTEADTFFPAPPNTRTVMAHV